MNKYDILSRDEVAELLGIAPQSLTNRIARGGQFPPYREVSPRCRVWLRSEVEAWVTEMPKRTSATRKVRVFRSFR